MLPSIIIHTYNVTYMADVAGRISAGTSYKLGLMRHKSDTSLKNSELML